MEKGCKEQDKVELQIQFQAEEIEDLRAENKKLHERIDYLIRQLFGSKSEKIDPRQLMLILGLDEVQQEDEPETPPSPSEPPLPKRKRRQLKDRLPEHLPLYRQAQTLKRRFGIELSRKTMSSWMWHIGNWLRIIYDEMKEEIRASGYLQADETCIKYIDPGTGRSQSGYLWVYHAPNVGVVFEWHQGRGTEHLNSMLGDYSGDLQCDGYQPYRTFNLSRETQYRYLIYACWAHVRRKFFEAKADSVTAAEILNQIQRLYRIESDLRDSAASHKERAKRRKESKIILNDIKESLDHGLSSHRPQSLTGKAISYTLNLWNELIRYADTGHIEIDNNLVENAIRPTAIGKKNWLFFGSPDSGWQSAVIFSILETCRKLGIDQQDYLHGVLAQLPTLTAQQARELTPARWLEKRAQVAA